MFNVTHLMIAQDLDYHNPTVKINFVLIVKTLIVQLVVNQMIALHSKIIVIQTINVISVLMIPIVVTILSVTIIYVLMYVQPINNALISN